MYIYIYISIHMNVTHARAMCDFIISHLVRPRVRCGKKLSKGKSRRHFFFSNFSSLCFCLLCEVVRVSDRMGC